MKTFIQAASPPPADSRQCRRTLRAALPALFLCAACLAPLRAEDGSSLTIKLAVIGPGSELYFWWGHLGLIIDDTSRADSPALFYDWGVFSFDQEDFYRNFAFGRLYYMAAVSSAESMLRHYVADNRDITLYTLNLDARAKARIRDIAAERVLPENRVYLYNHFTDNCVTEILHIIDGQTGNALTAAFKDAPGRMTLRAHVRRHTAASPFWDWFLNFLMGQSIDGPTALWDEMFLPAEAARNLASLTYTAANGETVSLVQSIERYNVSRGRRPVLDAPPDGTLRILPAAILFALIPPGLAALRRRCAARGRRAGAERAALALWLYTAAFALSFGAAGSALFFLTFFTNHDYARHNINVIFVNPALLAGVPLALTAAFARRERPRRAAAAALRALFAAVFLAALGSVCAHLSPAWYQSNLPTVVLTAPCALALALALPSPPRRRG